jgi:hypothetical protein
MEQSTLIILAIVFIAIVMAMQPAVCDCTSEGAASAPVMSAYLKKQIQLPAYIDTEKAPIAYKNYIDFAPRAVNEKFATLAPRAVNEKFGQGILQKQYLKQGGLGADRVSNYIEVQKRRPT